jgi:hypothetical protein
MRADPGDSPIIISDGSLTIHSAASWSQYTGDGDVIHHPDADKSVSSVDTIINGQSQTLTFNKESCTVEVTYGSDHIIFSAVPGQGLSMRPFGVFRPGADANTLTHNNPNAGISHVTIGKGLASAVDADASGHTTITIHYE